MKNQLSDEQYKSIICIILRSHLLNLMSRIVAVAVCLTFSVVSGIFLEKCELPEALEKEIRSYKEVVDSIIEFVVHKDGKGEVYKALEAGIDKFGPRLSGTETLESSIDALEKKAEKAGLNTSSQAVEVPYWTRQKEKVKLISPRKANIHALLLGGSVSAPKEGIEAEVLVVKTFKELIRKADQVSGKIVVIAPKWKGYFKTIKYRTHGAITAAKRGAVAVLVRSMAGKDFGLPHAGQMNYDPDVKQIPAAAISIEDAEMLSRMQRRGEAIKIKLNLQATDHGMKTSRNLMADLTGKESPDEYVMVSGHTDSWDVGTGAMDDGGGAMVSLFTPIILHRMELKPRRTVRAIMWTGEEQGKFGAKAYKKEFDSGKIVLAMESDEGVFNPTGLLMNGSPRAKCIVHEILQLLEPINATTIEADPSPGSDITVWADSPVPTAALRNDNENYFWYHHSIADRMEVLNSDEMDRSLAVFAAVSYVLADLKDTLPKNDDVVSDDSEDQLLKRSPFSKPIKKQIKKPATDRPDLLSSEEDVSDEHEKEKKKKNQFSPDRKKIPKEKLKKGKKSKSGK